MIFWLALLFLAVAWLDLAQTAIGRHVHALGGNSDAAEAAGTRPQRIIVTAFALSGALSAAVGLCTPAGLAHGRTVENRC